VQIPGYAVTIPARPYIGIGPKELVRIEDGLGDWLSRA
jgi:phage gpG-like protein